MFDKMVHKILRHWVRNGIIPAQDEDIYAYGLDLVLFTLLNISTVLITSVFQNNVKESLLLLAVVLPLQGLGGGYHAKTHLRCFLTMYIGWWISTLFLPFISPVAACIMVCISVPCIFALAPVPHPNVPISIGQKLKLKHIVRILTSCLILLSVLMMCAFDNTGGIVIAMGIALVGISMFAAYGKNYFLKNSENI